MCSICVCCTVPDPPRNLQLSCDNSEDGKVEVSWSPPDKAHGLVREYLVSVTFSCRLISRTIDLLSSSLLLCRLDGELLEFYSLIFILHYQTVHLVIVNPLTKPY